MAGTNGKLIKISRTLPEDRDEAIDLPLGCARRRRSQWPPALMFVAFLAFIYKMTELFVR